MKTEVVLDAFALIAYFGGEPAAEEVEAMLRAEAGMNALNVGEVVDRMTRHGQDPSDVMRAIAALRDSGLDVVPVDLFDGHLAGTLRAKFYDRTSAPLSLADFTTLATALRYGCAVATADGPMIDTARAAGVKVAVLPDSRGRRHD